MGRLFYLAVRERFLLRKRFAITDPSRVLISVFLRKKSNLAAALYCGKTGIRTLGARKGTTVFETAPIVHSGIFPVVQR